MNVRGRSDGIGVVLFSDNADAENGRIDFRTNYAEIKQARNAPLILSTNSAERARIDAAGNVGIGTSSPTMKLDISGTSYGGVYIKSTSTNYSGLLLENTNSATKWQIGVEGGTYHTAGKLNIGIDAVGSAIIIDSSRNVGIGTSTPLRKLHVASVGAGNGVSVSGTAPNISITNADTDPNSNTMTSVFALATSAGNYSLNAGEVAWLGIGASRGDFIVNPNYAGAGVKNIILQPTSGSVGIGTSSANKSSSSTALTVNTSSAANYAALELSSGDTLNWHINSNNAAVYDVTGGTRPRIFYTNGSERLRIDSAGSVGIGTSSPSSLGKLAVVGGNIVANGGGTSDPEFRLSGASGGVTRNYAMGTDGSQRLYWYDYTASAYRMLIDNAGNVGIGTSAPSTAFYVYRTDADAVGTFQGLQTESGGTGKSAIQIDVNGKGGFAIANDATSGTRALTISNNSGYGVSTVEAMRITSSGSVGIGTSAPGAKLTVKLGNIGIDQDEAPQQFFGAGGNVAGTNTTGGVLTVFGHAPNGVGDTSTPPYDGTNFVGAAGLMARGFSESAQYRGSLEFFTKTASDANATSRMLITHDGNVGIGTSAPTQKLTVNGGLLLNTTNQISFYDTSYYIRASTGLEINSNDFTRFLIGGTEKARIDASGNLLVGTTVSEGPSRISSVSTASGTACVGYRNTAGAGSVFASFINAANNAIIGTISNSGNTSTSYNTTSDYRLKEDTKPVLNPIDRLMQLNPINFAWKADGSRTDGFLAHEAQAVVPEAVTGTKDAVDKDGKPQYQGIDQSKLVPLLTAALQDAIKRIEQLESQINSGV